MRTEAGLHAGSAVTLTLKADGAITICPVRDSLDALETCGPPGVDEAILKSVLGDQAQTGPGA
jgi:hypothetical protein